MEHVKPLRQLGVFKVKIEGVEKKEPSSFKGKQYPAKLVVVFEAEDGRRIDGTYKLPFTDEANKWDKKGFESLLAVCGVTKATELKGKTLAVLVAPGEYNGKVYWNPRNYYDAKYLQSPEDQLDAALDVDLTSDDDLGF